MKRSIFFWLMSFAAMSASFAQNHVHSMEYWFDQDFSGRTAMAISPGVVTEYNGLIDASSLSGGVHILNLRFLDDSNRYSSVISSVFTSGLSASMITEWQYWFDQDFQNAQSASIPANSSLDLNQAVQTSGLSNGLHRIHLRFRSDGGYWSSAISAFFNKHGEGSSLLNQVTAYRWWMDSLFSSASVQYLTQPANPADIQLNLNLLPYPIGQHTVHYQFLDTLGLWSSVLSDTVMRNAVPVPVFTASLTEICAGGGVAFTNNSSESNQYIWDFGDGDTSHAVNPFHIYQNPGVYSVSLTAIDSLTGEDSTLVQNAMITVIDVPVAAFNFSLNLATASFSNQSTYGQLYNWSFGDGASSNAQNPVHTYSANGTYNVSLIVANACGTDTLIQQVSVIGLSLDDLISEQYSVFPNPVHDGIFVKAKGNTDLSNTGFRLLDPAGRLVALLHPAPSSSGTILLNEGIADLPAGTYFLEIRRKEGVSMHRIIKN
jgi:PKD repeat protein